MCFVGMSKIVGICTRVWCEWIRPTSWISLYHLTHWGRDDIDAFDSFRDIFLNENIWISIKISLKFIAKGPIDNIAALVHIMAWLRPGDKPLSGPMMVRLPTHICVTRPQWVNDTRYQGCGDVSLQKPITLYHIVPSIDMIHALHNS